MNKENIEKCLCKTFCAGCVFGVCKCPCHSPKVELPECWEERFDKLMLKEPEYYEQEDISKWRVDVKDFIRQTLSHSTTQLVEKIKGECEGLNPHSQKNPHMIGEYNWYCEGFNQALSEAIKIISKYA